MNGTGEEKSLSERARCCHWRAMDAYGVYQVSALPRDRLKMALGLSLSLYGLSRSLSISDEETVRAECGGVASAPRDDTTTSSSSSSSLSSSSSSRLFCLGWPKCARTSLLRACVRDVMSLRPNLTAVAGSAPFQSRPFLVFPGTSRATSEPTRRRR